MVSAQKNQLGIDCFHKRNLQLTCQEVSTQENNQPQYEKQTVTKPSDRRMVIQQVLDSEWCGVVPLKI